MEEFIKKKEAIMAIISEPPEAHYPSWYYDKIDNLDVYKFNCTDNSDKLRSIFIKVCKSIHDFESEMDSAYDIGINLPDSYTDWIEPVIKFLEFVTNAKVYETGDLKNYSDISLWLYEGGYSLDFADVVVRTDQLSKKAFIQSKSFDEVLRLARQAGDMASSVPIIPPICPDRKRYRISSTFGRRADPKTGRPAFHQGLDFAAKKGEPVYVTGDGVVESVRFDLRGYGNQIIINHGFGYKTRYAHLSFVNVVEGMKVQRGECIGSVGNTGKSTGSHLHYEVIYKDRPTNPANYMDLNMSVEEYATMAQVSRKNAGRVVIDPRRVVRN